MKKFAVATVPTNVHGNFIANSICVSMHETEDDARKAAKELDTELENQFRQRDDFGNGAIRGEDVIIHDGYNCL